MDPLFCHREYKLGKYGRPSDLPPKTALAHSSETLSFVGTKNTKNKKPSSNVAKQERKENFPYLKEQNKGCLVLRSLVEKFNHVCSEDSTPRVLDSLGHQLKNLDFDPLSTGMNEGS